MYKDNISLDILINKNTKFSVKLNEISSTSNSIGQKFSTGAKFGEIKRISAKTETFEPY